MNQITFISNLINSYRDFPKVQQDMRKIVKYIESWQRLTLEPVINNAPAKAISPELAALDASTADFEASEAFTADVEADSVTIAKAVMAQVIDRKAGSFAAVKDVRWC